jgi:hypothetical protein
MTSLLPSSGERHVDRLGAELRLDSRCLEERVARFDCSGDLLLRGVDFLARDRALLGW